MSIREEAEELDLLGHAKDMDEIHREGHRKRFGKEGIIHNHLHEDKLL